MYEPKLKKPPVYDRQKSSKKPMTKTVPVILDDEATEALEVARAELGAAELALSALELLLSRADGDGKVDPKDVTAATSRVRKAEKAVQAATDDLLENHTATFTLVSIGRKRYSALVEEHPPTEQQIEDHQKEVGSDPPYNSDTFPAALLNLVSVAPKLSVEEFQEIIDDWNITEILELVGSAIEICTSRRTADLGKGFG